jgi:hypothetical protein
MELKSGDLFIEGSEQFSDDRDQLVSWDEYAQYVPTYCEQVGIASNPARFVQDLRTWLTETIRTTDAAFPTNTSLSIKDGEPVLRRLAKQPEPEGFASIDQLLSERMPECNIIEILTDTDHWLTWTAAFGPLSAFESRLFAPRPRTWPPPSAMAATWGQRKPLGLCPVSIGVRRPTSISTISRNRNSWTPTSV